MPSRWYLQGLYIKLRQVVYVYYFVTQTNWMFPLPECRFNSAIILQPKKLFYFTLVYLVFQFSCIILLHNPWHAIDVFVRLFECHFKNRRSYVVNSIMTENVDKNRLIFISSCIYFIIRFRFRSLGFGFHSWF